MLLRNRRAQNNQDCFETPVPFALRLESLPVFYRLAEMEKRHVGKPRKIDSVRIRVRLWKNPRGSANTRIWPANRYVKKPDIDATKPFLEVFDHPIYLIGAESRVAL